MEHPRSARNFAFKLLIFLEPMVGVARIELATPAMSTQCSTTELYAHALALSNERVSSGASHAVQAGILEQA